MIRRSDVVTTAVVITAICVTVLTPVTLQLLVNMVVFYSNPELSIRYAEAESRSADTTLRVCESFNQISLKYPEVGPMPENFIRVCVDHLPEIQQLVNTHEAH